MFYSQFILAKKGPLGTIWIAAHLERKLRKNQVADTDIGVSVDSILFPDVPIALRLSSHLLLGVVRIYSRKVNYLFDDCSEALLKIKQAFRSTAVDLPPEESTAPYHSITLPETFDLDDFELPDNDIFQGNYVDHHVSTREQITLQDTMEGVVYTTSQFGLDERFGDGDASQIGLDLDEVLLTDKAATLEHDDCSVSPQVSHQKDEKKEEIDDLPAAVEVTDYAEGPSTPGLEEPNLFGTQMDQGNNGADYHNSEDFTSMKSTENVSSVHQRESDVIDCSLPNNVKQFGVDSHHENSDCVMVELDGKREEQEHLACRMTDQENLIPNDHCSTSLPLMVSSNREYMAMSVAECASGMISASDIPEKVEDLHDEVLMDNEPVVAPLDQTVIDGVVPSGVSTNEVATPSFSHVTSDQEDLSCKLLSKMDGSQGPDSDGHLKDGPTSSKNEVLNNHEISKNEGESCPFDEAQKSIVTSPVGSPRRPQAVDVEAQASEELMEAEALNHDSHGALQRTESILRPCTSHVNQPSLPSVEGYQETIEPSISKGNLDFGKSDVQGGSQIFSDKAESINKSAASEMPEPEKLLSLSYQHDGEANDLLMESTPDNQGISDGQTVAARVKGISGKKRSLTESTLTMQSVDLVESYGGPQSKKTAASVPDDDDLLSSILVGRRSSVLKVKPSPAAPEIASTKRFRSGPRTSAVKRKVLMDDMMVLHGDTIRQQLTNTEDIRRIRKKAPCTQHEIVMIQRQFLEDEIFHESIFTGLSSDLSILRNETFDLTGIKVFHDGLDSSFIEKTNNEVHEVERNVESMAVQPQGVAEVQPTEFSVLSGSHQPEINLGSHDTDAYVHSNIVSHVKDVDGSLNAEMNDAGGNIEVSEAENYSVGLGHESSSLTEVVENSLCIPNDFIAPHPLVDKANDPAGSVHTDVLSIPSDQNLNTSHILEDIFVEDKGDRTEAGAIENEERSLEIGTEVQTDGLEANDSYASLATGSKATDENTGNQISFNGDLPMQANGNMAAGSNEDQIGASGMGCEDTRSGCMFGEDTKVDCLESVPLGLDEKESYLNEEENPICQETGMQNAVCPENSAIRSPFAGHNDENDMIVDDTGFLNVGDDEIIDDDDDFIPCAEGTHLENSGWSSRTRAVAKYLQTLFEKDDLNGRQNLHLNNILAGKTRKEASRMFFETLVLKTRDYVHVEQPKPFASIFLKPRMKLMKSDF